MPRLITTHWTKDEKGRTIEHTRPAAVGAPRAWTIPHNERADKPQPSVCACDDCAARTAAQRAHAQLLGAARLAPERTTTRNGRPRRAVEAY